ncbi:MAG: lysozyme inhibitor LprI family protein [Novosphingobium sp.]
MTFLAVLLATAASADEPQWNCDEPVAQQEMNWCAARDYEKANAELNVQWKKTATEMKRRDAEWDSSFDKRPGYFAALLEAQRAWIKYRDAHCTSEGYLFRGGSMEPLIVSTCKTKLTEDRTQQLQFLIEQ